MSGSVNEFHLRMGFDQTILPAHDRPLCSGLGPIILALVAALFLAGCGSEDSADTVVPSVPTAVIFPDIGLNLAENVPITIAFDESMAPGSLALGGDMAGEIVDTVWSTTTKENDTLTLSGSWVFGNDRTLTVDVMDTAGNPIATLNLIYNTSVIKSGGEIIITEMMIDPTNPIDVYGEWLEIFNTTADSVFELKGYQIMDSGIDFHQIVDSLILMPSSFLVLCSDADPSVNGGVECAYRYTSFILGNSGDDITLYDSIAMITMDDVSYPSGFNTLGKASNLSSDKFSMTSNDVLANWCDATLPMANDDKGSPGGENITCP